MTTIRCVFNEDGKFYLQLFFRWCFVWVSVKIQQHEKNDVSEGIDINKTCLSKERELCHFWFFKDVGFKFEEHVCNGGLNLLTMAHSLKNIAILSAKGATFRCLLMGNSKNEALKKLNNSVTYDRGVLQIWILARIKH